jgi:hypothetical protein
MGDALNLVLQKLLKIVWRQFFGYRHQILNRFLVRADCLSSHGAQGPVLRVQIEYAQRLDGARPRPVIQINEWADCAVTDKKQKTVRIILVRFKQAFVIVGWAIVFEFSAGLFPTT